MSKVLCFGDSNTWGYNPKTKERFSNEIRWTGLLQKRLEKKEIQIIEEGLCGRTTIYEDETRPNRRGIEKIQEIFAEDQEIDAVVIMLGTNDCKTFNHTSSEKIAEGMDHCLDIILEHVDAENVLLISPILLGESVWKQEYDPEFSKESVEISKGLKGQYANIAKKHGIHFFSAADYVFPSKDDQEHLNEKGHKKLADVIYKELLQMPASCA